MSRFLQRYGCRAGRVSAVEAASALSLDSPSWMSGKLVMIVDDEEAVRLIVSDVVGDLGARILTAEDAISAMELADRLPALQPDVLITDIGMPGGLNGRQLAVRMREKFPGLKVLFITGYAEQNILDEGLLEPGCALLVKPFSTDALLRKLHHLLEQV